MIRPAITGLMVTDDLGQMPVVAVADLDIWKGGVHLKHLIHGSMHADADLASWNATNHP